MPYILLTSHYGSAQTLEIPGSKHREAHFKHTCQSLVIEHFAQYYRKMRFILFLINLRVQSRLIFFKSLDLL